MRWGGGEGRRFGAGVGVGDRGGGRKGDVKLLGGGVAWCGEAGIMGGNYVAGVSARVRGRGAGGGGWGGREVRERGAGGEEEAGLGGGEVYRGLGRRRVVDGHRGKWTREGEWEGRGSEDGGRDGGGEEKKGGYVVGESGEGGWKSWGGWEGGGDGEVGRGGAGGGW